MVGRRSLSMVAPTIPIGEHCFGHCIRDDHRLIACAVAALLLPSWWHFSSPCHVSLIGYDYPEQSYPNTTLKILRQGFPIQLQPDRETMDRSEFGLGRDVL